QDLAALVAETLRATGLAAPRLEIEITEDCITGDPVRSLDVVRRLKAQGCTISMDDYGTGYSSLANLRLFPFDKLKIDRSFISDVTTNHISSAIVKSTVALARALGIETIAEGVEREDQFAFLQAIGCSSAQGYLFGRPSDLAAFNLTALGPLDRAEAAKPGGQPGLKGVATGFRRGGLPGQIERSRCPARTRPVREGTGQVLWTSDRWGGANRRSALMERSG